MSDLKNRICAVAVIAVLVLQVTAGHAQPRRLRSVIRAYLIETGYPAGRPGWVVDHIIPLCAGGTDGPPNLQWQEKAPSYRKDVFERQLCREMKRQGFAAMKREIRKP